MITRLTFYLSMACFVGGLILMIHALLPRRSRNHQYIKLRLWELVFRSIIESLSVWIWLLPVAHLLALGFWIGHNEHWFYDYAWLIVTAISITVFSIAGIRIYRTGAAVRYLKVHFWFPCLLILLCGAAASYEKIQHVDGPTPHSAVNKVFNEIALNTSEYLELTEVLGELPADLDPQQWTSYEVWGEQELYGRLTVRFHKLFVCQVTHVEMFIPSIPNDILESAKKLINESQNKEDAILLLQTVITYYPGTPAASEAMELLESFGEPVK